MKIVLRGFFAVLLMAVCVLPAQGQGKGESFTFTRFGGGIFGESAVLADMGQGGDSDDSFGAGVSLAVIPPINAFFSYEEVDRFAAAQAEATAYPAMGVITTPVGFSDFSPNHFMSTAHHVKSQTDAHTYLDNYSRGYAATEIELGTAFATEPGYAHPSSTNVYGTMTTFMHFMVYGDVDLLSKTRNDDDPNDIGYDGFEMVNVVGDTSVTFLHLGEGVFTFTGNFAASTERSSQNFTHYVTGLHYGGVNAAYICRQRVPLDSGDAPFIEVRETIVQETVAYTVARPGVGIPHYEVGCVACVNSNFFFGNDLSLIDGPISDTPLLPEDGAVPPVPGIPANTDSPIAVPNLQPSFVVGRLAAYHLNSGDIIALDKTALLPGRKANYSNYTNFSKGLNSIVIDIDGELDSISAADFQFKVGNDNNAENWATAPVPESVTFDSGGGELGTDRVTVVFADNSIANKWLQVTVLANANTGLAEDDVFYFGNLVGEVGNSSTSANVDVFDLLVFRQNYGSSAPEDRADFTKDGHCNVFDLLAFRQNYGQASIELIEPN